MSLAWLLVLRASKGTPYQWRAYNAYLRSATWRRRSDACLARAGHLCEACRTAPAVHAHHRSYALIGCEPRRHLAALCRRCHSDAHRRSV